MKNKNKGGKRKGKKGRGSKDERLAFLVNNRQKAMSDGTVMGLTDGEDRREGNVPPTNVPKNINELIHWFKDTVSFGITSSNTLTETDTAIGFRLVDIPQYASYATIFDQYAIVCVVARIYPITIDTTSGDVWPRLVSIIDHDDVNVVSLAASGDYATNIETSGNIGHTRVIFPRAALAAYAGAFTSYANQRTWLDCASTGVYHYGLKWSVDVSSRAIGYAVTCDYYTAFRNNR